MLCRVSIAPDRTGAVTKEGAAELLVLLPNTVYAVAVAAPVPPFATASVPSSVTAPCVALEGVRPVVPPLKLVTASLVKAYAVATFDPLPTQMSPLASDGNEPPLIDIVCQFEPSQYSMTLPVHWICPAVLAPQEAVAAPGWIACKTQTFDMQVSHSKALLFQAIFGLELLHALPTVTCARAVGGHIEITRSKSSATPRAARKGERKDMKSRKGKVIETA
jgi:hypothetical protein